MTAYLSSAEFMKSLFKYAIAQTKFGNHQISFFPNMGQLFQ